MKKKVFKKFLIFALIAICNMSLLSACNSTRKTLSAPKNFQLSSHWLEWTSDENAEWNKIYVKRPGKNFEETYWDIGDGDMVPSPNNYTSIHSLKLAVGENIIRVVSEAYRENNTTSYSQPGEIAITVTDTAEELAVLNVNSDVFFDGYSIYTNGNCMVYLKHPDENEFVSVDGYIDHGSFFGTLPTLRLGESTLKVIRRATRTKLDGTTLVNYTDSEPAFIPIVVNKIETRQVSPPANLRVTGSGTHATLAWDCKDNENSTCCSVAVKHPGKDDFNYSAQVFYNSTQLNWLGLALGDNEIKITTPGKGAILEDDTYIIYESGITFYTLTVHKEQKITTPANFQIKMIHDNLSLTWDRDPITDGNTISNNNTLIEVKNPGQDEFKSAGISGALSKIEVNGNWLVVGENIVRVRIATGNVGIFGGVVTKYTLSDWGYVVLVKDAKGNVSIKE